MFEGFDLGVEGGGDDLARFGVEAAVGFEPPVEGRVEREVVLGVFGPVVGGAAVAVEGVGHAAERVAQLGRRSEPGDGHELGFDLFERGGPFGGVGGGDDLGVAAGDLPGRERVGDERQGFEFASQVDRAAGDPVLHPALRP